MRLRDRASLWVFNDFSVRRIYLWGIVCIVSVLAECQVTTAAALIDAKSSPMLAGINVLILDSPCVYPNGAGKLEWGNGFVYGGNFLLPYQWWPRKQGSFIFHNTKTVAFFRILDGKENIAAHLLIYHPLANVKRWSFPSVRDVEPQLISLKGELANSHPRALFLPEGVFRVLEGRFGVSGGTLNTLRGSELRYGLIYHLPHSALKLARAFIGRFLSETNGLNTSFSGDTHLLELIHSNQGIDKSGHESKPCSVTYGILYVICFTVIFATVSFRFLVRGKDFCKPFTSNLVLLFAVYIGGVYGFYVLLGLIFEGCSSGA